MSDEIDDDALVAFLDNELDEAARAALQKRIAAEPLLRARLDQLAAGSLPFKPAFLAVLREAPLSRMQVRLDAVVGAFAAAPRRRRASLRWIGPIAAALALLLVGWGIGRYVPVPGALAPISAGSKDDWRQAVADYASLYSSETFSSGGDAAARGAALAQLSKRLGVPLSSATIELPGLINEGAVLFEYDGAPLGQIAYLDGATPVVFCIIRNGEKDASLTVEKRQDLALASWARGGLGFLVAGRVPTDRATALAEALSARF